MWEDPIVAEVHRIRQELAAKFNFDIKAIFADLRKRQAALGDRLVSPKKRAQVPGEGDRGPTVASSRKKKSRKKRPKLSL